MNTETANLRSPFAIAILACVSVVLGSGCTSVKMQDFNPGTTHSIGAKTIEKDGLKITVDPFFDPERSETYFKLNTLKEGIAVLHVQLENQTTATTFLIHKENFRLLIGSDAEKRANEEKRDQSSPTGQAVGVTGAALVFG
ncbi:MAG: hypothetical protein HY301_07215 [Verrucomicrobia bacterium]|nr:hypothetical protein [Verrucomicrobiota bacterium]